MFVCKIAKKKNYRVDMLARMAATADPKLPRSVPLEVRTSSSIGEEAEVMGVDNKRSWINPIISYVCDDILPVDRKQARMLKC